MIFDSMQALAAALAPGDRLLGLDLGDKTVGLAVADPALTLASPLETIRRKKFTIDAEALLAIVDREGIGGLVLGYPVSMDGTEGPRCQSTRQFARNLERLRDLPMALWDERLSTAAVERLLTSEADLSRARRAQVVDKMAAAYILQGALDSLRSGN